MKVRARQGGRSRVRLFPTSSTSHPKFQCPHLPPTSAYPRPLRAGASDGQMGAMVQLDISASRKRDFYFDHAFGPSSTQDHVYNTIARPVVDGVLNGFNGTVFAYGQTGSGKTYTMFGPDSNFSTDIKNSSGVVLRSCQELLMGAEALRKIGISVSYTAQFVEIYNEKCTDLLSGLECSIRRDNGDLINDIYLRIKVKINIFKAISLLIKSIIINLI